MSANIHTTAPLVAELTDFVNQALASRVKSLKCLSVLGKNTGHRMIALELTEEIKMGRGYWKFNTNLLKDPTYTDMIKNKIRQAREERDRNEWSDIREWWDYLKFLIKTATIAYCKEKERTRSEFLANLQYQKRTLEHDLSYGIGGEQTRDELNRILCLLEDDEAREAEGCRVRARVPNYEEREPGIAYISKMEKSHATRSLIYALKDDNGQTKHGTENVLKIAQEFYINLVKALTNMLKMNYLALLS